jgi:hypothetical protein
MESSSFSLRPPLLPCLEEGELKSYLKIKSRKALLLLIKVT